MKIEVSEKIGSVSVLITEPSSPRAMMTFAHGAGAPMTHPFMASLSHELAERGIGTVRFNFPYMENKKGRPDVPAVAHATIEAVAAYANRQFASTPLYLSGKSFGGRMSSQYMSKFEPAFVKGLVFFGFPLHAAGQPGVERADHLSNIAVPMLFLQGTRDALAEWALISDVTSKLPTATLAKFDGADHSFKAGKQNLIPVIAQAVASWIE